MDFDHSDRLAGHRAAARAWVAEHLDPSWVELEEQTGTHHTAALHALLAEQGLLGAGWPARYGGTEVDPDYAAAVFEEIAGAGIRMEGWGTTLMIIRTVLELGTEEQKQEIVGGALRGEVVIALGYTEPGSGSDAAAAAMRAVRSGDGWIVNGTKMFTSTAQASTHVILLTRTDPDAAKHRGLTTFLIPLSRAGIDIQPIYTLGGQRTNSTYYTDVAVADSERLGDVNGGWSVMRVALTFERGTGQQGAGPTLSAQVAAWARSEPDPAGGTRYDSAALQEELARLAIDEEVIRLLGLQASWIAEQGGLPVVEGSMAKLYWTERDQAHHAALLDLLGPAALVKRGADGAILDGLVEHEFRNSVVGTIYGGASEILRDIVAERRLGLPRNRPTG